MVSVKVDTAFPASDPKLVAEYRELERLYQEAASEWLATVGRSDSTEEDWQKAAKGLAGAGKKLEEAKSRLVY
jgi:hypothetical protein